MIAVVACLMIRHRNMERARLELAARSSNTDWLDPKLMAVGYQVGQAIGWRKLVSLAAVGLLAAGLAKEWTGRDRAARGRRAARRTLRPAATVVPASEMRRGAAASAARASRVSSSIRRTSSSTLSNLSSGLIQSMKATSMTSP